MISSDYVQTVATPNARYASTDGTGKIISGLPACTLPFGAGGVTTASSTFSTVGNSDITFKPTEFMQGSVLWVKFIYVVKTSLAFAGSIQVIRQNSSWAGGAGTAVAGSAKTTDGTTNVNILDSGWLDFHQETVLQSYQIQIKSANAGSVVTYISANMFISQVKF